MGGEPDYAKVLDDDRRPDATPEVLSQVVARYRRRRARRHRLVATTVVVVALAGAGVDLGIGHPSRVLTASGVRAPLRPPLGLRWDSSLAAASHRRAAASGAGVSAAPLEQATSASLSGPGPGEFGFVAPSPRLSPSGALPSAVPSATRTDAGGGYGLHSAKGCSSGCGVLYVGGRPAVLFTRRIDGLMLKVSLEHFSFPASVQAAGALSSASARAIAVESLCPATSELTVTISSKFAEETLFVPSGGNSAEPFLVVASAASRLQGGRWIALAVTRTSPSVASVSASFGDGRTAVMVPKDGWALLGTVLPANVSLARAGTVNLVAKALAGAVLEKARLPRAGALATEPVTDTCHYLVLPAGAAGAAPPLLATGRPRAAGTSKH